jgi:uncharacterized alpha/beta hydrolase family protein
MANQFKNSITGSIGTVETIVYQVPPDTVSTVIGMSVANTNESSNIGVSVLITDASETKTNFLVKNTLIPNGTSVVLIGGDQKVVLEANDTISVESSLSNSADVIVSVLEIS